MSSSMHREQQLLVATPARAPADERAPCCVSCAICTQSQYWRELVSFLEAEPMFLAQTSPAPSRVAALRPSTSSERKQHSWVAAGAPSQRLFSSCSGERTERPASALPSSGATTGALHWTRRSLIQTTLLLAAGCVAGSPALAEKATAEAPAVPRDVRNQLELYVDLQRGYKMYRPKGWNEFDGDPGNTKYEKKFQDIIQPLEFVTVFSIPVKPGKTLASLGDAEAVGKRLAEQRGATLVAANQKESDGILYYVFEYVREPAHQLSLLTINRGRLFSVNACASEARWKRLEKLLRAVVDSFVPQL